MTVKINDLPENRSPRRFCRMPTQQINCPVCNQALQKKNVMEGLEIDFCDSHGVWLDAGELERLSQAPATGQTAAPSTTQQIGQKLGTSMVYGAGATVGHRLVGALIDSVFRR